MLFDSVFSSDFRTVGLIINASLDRKGLTRGEIKDIINQYSIGDANAEKIYDSLVANKSWPLIEKEESGKYISTLENRYNRSITVIEKKWLNSIIADKRMKLFTDSIKPIDESGTLFNFEDIVFFDQNNDGDPYDDKNYITCFRKVLSAIKEKRYIKVKYHSTGGKISIFSCVPIKLEYSIKNDKFRILEGYIEDVSKTGYLRMSGIEDVEIGDYCSIFDQYNMQINQKSVVLEVTDERATKERLLLHFSPLKREAEQISDNQWRIKIYYDEDMEEEIVIDILSFGRFVKVVEPQSFIKLIKMRLIRQNNI